MSLYSEWYIGVTMFIYKECQWLLYVICIDPISYVVFSIVLIG